VSDVQINAFSVLSVLCQGPEAACKLLELGAFNSVIQAMQHHTDVAKLQSVACDLLACMVGYETSKWPDVECVIRAIGVVVGAMKRHTKDTSLQSNACWALYALSEVRTQECFAAICAAGGVVAIINALTQHPTRNMYDALQALVFLSENENNTNEHQLYSKSIIDCCGVWMC
jgi:hypothetical protein